MNAAVPSGWRLSFTAKQRRSIGFGAWAHGRKRRILFRVSSLFSTSSSSSPFCPSFLKIRSLFFSTTVLWGHTQVCFWGQPVALFCACFSGSDLPALRPSDHRFITRSIYWPIARLAAQRCAVGFYFASITQRSGIAGAVECM